MIVGISWLYHVQSSILCLFLSSFYSDFIFYASEMSLLLFSCGKDGHASFCKHFVFKQQSDDNK